MGTQRIDVTGKFKSDNALNFFEPASVKATTAPWEDDVLIMEDGSTRDGVFGGFDIPQDYVGSPNLIVIWTSEATSGVVAFDYDYRNHGGDDSESFDQAGQQESANVDDTAPSVAHERMEAVIALTAGNFAAGDSHKGGLFRDKTDADDTLADEAIVHYILFEYADA